MDMAKIELAAILLSALFVMFMFILIVILLFDTVLKPGPKDVWNKIVPGMNEQDMLKLINDKWKVKKSISNNQIQYEWVYEKNTLILEDKKVSLEKKLLINLEDGVVKKVVRCGI